jgi:predicted RNA-binding protein with PUA-like domain
MKSEPNAYSIDDLVKDGKTHWDGVRGTPRKPPPSGS